MFFDEVEMEFRAVALVLFKLIRRIFFGAFLHHRVARDFRDDRRGGNGKYEGVPSDDGPLIGGKIGDDLSAVNIKMPFFAQKLHAFFLKPKNGAAHREQARLQDIYLINFLFIRLPQRPRHAWVRTKRFADLLSFFGRDFFGVVHAKQKEIPERFFIAQIDRHRARHHRPRERPAANLIHADQHTPPLTPYFLFFF